MGVPSPIAPWTDRLLSAREPEAVAQVVREYLSQLTPQRLAAVPQLPGAIEPGEIGATAMLLVKRMYADLQASPDLEEMVTFFAAASRRLSEVTALASRGPDALERRSFF